MTRTQKAKIIKLIEIYSRLKELEKEYEELRKELEPVPPEEPIVLNGFKVWKTKFTQTKLDLPKDLREKLKKKYGKVVEVTRVNVRRA